MKTIIAGSRDVYPEEIQMIHECLDDYHKRYPIAEVVSGTARGIDTIGEEWAKKNGIPVTRMPADWDRHGVKAGPIRNKQMVHYADRAIVFWDMESNGTRNLIDLTETADKPITIWPLTVPGYLGPKPSDDKVIS